MSITRPTFSEKLKWALPWLSRYPAWWLNALMKRVSDSSGPQHLIFVVADHFEPSWNEKIDDMDVPTQLRKLDGWYEKARRTADTVRDHYGVPFTHSYFYPIEQYHEPVVRRVAELQAEGLGEVEIHLHHGVQQPDTAGNLREVIERYRDILAYEHKCLSTDGESSLPRYGFVHGNLSLANSADNFACGVDSEMQVLAETGCYADFTLPSAPHRSQVPRFNAIYECGNPLNERAPHRSGPNLRIGSKPALPILITGPLSLYLDRELRSRPSPRIDCGILAHNYTMNLARLNRWRNSRISVEGRPDWVFVKLSCHGFFYRDESQMIGDDLRRFVDEMLEYGDKDGAFRVHFTTARESFNIVMAAVDGKDGDPEAYRDYRLVPIMRSRDAESKHGERHALQGTYS